MRKRELNEENLFHDRLPLFDAGSVPELARGSRDGHHGLRLCSFSDGNQPTKLRQRRPIRPFADTNSMENSSPRDFFNGVYFAHFDVNLRKPILE